MKSINEIGIKMLKIVEKSSRKMCRSSPPYRGELPEETHRTVL